MIVYFAGSGRKVELSERILSVNKSNWGVLLSYKDIKTKDGLGSKRLKDFVANKKKIKKANE